MKTYQLFRTKQGRGRCWVYTDTGRFELDPCVELWGFSDGTLEWGQDCRATDQLALALLYDATRSEDLALHYYSSFAVNILRGLPTSDHTMTEEWVLRWALFQHAMALKLPLVVALSQPWEDSSHAWN